MGHVLRRGEAFLERAAFAASQPSVHKQAVPAPWFSMMSFADDAVQQQGLLGHAPSETELVALADKNVWNARAESLRWALPVTYMSHCVWSSWQQGFQVSEQTPCLLHLVLLLCQGRPWLVWLEREIGPVAIGAEDLLHGLRCADMSKRVVFVDILVDERWVDAILPSIPHLAKQMWADCDIACSWSQFPGEWLGKYSRFAGLD